LYGGTPAVMYWFDALKLTIAGAGTELTLWGPACTVPAGSPAAFFTLIRKSVVFALAGAMIVDPFWTGVVVNPVAVNVAVLFAEIVAFTVTGEPSVTVAGVSVKPLTVGGAMTVSDACLITVAAVVAVLLIVSVNVSVVPGVVTALRTMVTLFNVPVPAAVLMLPLSL
jgi:hypothetical protein